MLPSKKGSYVVADLPQLLKKEIQIPVNSEWVLLSSTRILLSAADVSGRHIFSFFVDHWFPL
jgi:hypothetical protein